MFDNDYLADRERWNSQIRENSARTATAWGTVHSSGWGEIILDDPIMFDTVFVAQPTVSYGFALDDDNQVPDPIDVTLSDGHGGTSTTRVLRLPRCGGGVLSWVQDPAGFYIGAHVFVTVSTVDPIMATQAWLDASLTAGVVTPPGDYQTDPGYDITHSFVFSALAIKEIGG